MKGRKIEAWVIQLYLLDGYPLSELMTTMNLSDYRPEIFRRFAHESSKGYYKINGEYVEINSDSKDIYNLLFK